MELKLNSESPTTLTGPVALQARASATNLVLGILLGNLMGAMPGLGPKLERDVEALLATIRADPAMPNDVMDEIARSARTLLSTKPT